MENTPLYRMVDRILGGQLDDTLTTYAEQGLSPGRMALRLAADHQVEVSGPTLRKWVAALGQSESGRPPQTAQSAQTRRPAQTAQTAQPGGAHVAVAS